MVIADHISHFMTNNFCVNGQRTIVGFKLFTVLACIFQILMFVICNYINEIIFFSPKKPDCCPTEGKQKRMYKIFKSKNLTNSVAGELSFLLIYTQQAKSNRTRFLLLKETEKIKSRARNWF